ncbi:unnamed protein product [Cylicocyclus nassatus]|uniref:Uncharacterized protein n=1 Tax=Cylicocyclus nassatus TaxID=53992 RepID=A0AA36H7D1_CYLNA|nr:unnamed protein product [Cylicocyclus nassatus]
MAHASPLLPRSEKSAVRRLARLVRAAFRQDEEENTVSSKKKSKWSESDLFIESLLKIKKALDENVKLQARGQGKRSKGRIDAENRGKVGVFAVIWWRGRTEFSYSYLIACSATDFVDVLPSAMRLLCTPKGTMWITWLFLDSNLD